MLNMSDQSPTKRGFLPSRSEAAERAAVELRDSLPELQQHLRSLQDAENRSGPSPLDPELHRRYVRGWIEQSCRLLHIIQAWPATADDYVNLIAFAHAVRGQLTSEKMLSAIYDRSKGKFIAQLREHWQLRPRAKVNVIRASPTECEQPCVPNDEDAIGQALQLLDDALRQAKIEARPNDTYEQQQRVDGEIIQDMADRPSYVDCRPAHLLETPSSEQSIARAVPVGEETADPPVPPTAASTVQLERMPSVSSPHDPEPGSEGKCCCLLVGDFWLVRYFDEQAYYDKCVCLPYLATLLAHPERSFSVANLLGDPEGKLLADNQLGAECEMDREGIQAIKLRLEEINEAINETGGSDRLDEEKCNLLEKLEHIHRKHKWTGRSPFEKEHHRIASRLRAFMKKLREQTPQMPKLAAHLKAALKLDRPHFGYYPPPGQPRWKTSRN